ncbi:MAG: MBL fold metallo-hydrolase [Planctomycetota bacterium]
MVNNAPVKTLKHREITIEGYSRAAVQSYWRVPELSLGFDLGGQPWSFMGTERWFVSHGHLDHIAALPVYVTRRRMMKMEPPTIYLPGALVTPVREVLKQFSRMDRGRAPCELIPVEPGEEIELSRELIVSIHATTHTVPSVGYVVWDRRKKLKPEYTDLAGHEIRDLREAGTEVTREVRTPIIAYLGDSSPPGLDNNPAMYQAQVLITELTFVDPKHTKEKIHKNGHMHLDDLVDRAGEFKNELVIAGHLSTRYHPKQAEAMVKRRLPDMLDGRLKLWL